MTPVEDISAVTDKDEYYYEVAEFISLLQAGKLESEINSHENSLITIEIIDEVRRQLGIVYPADHTKTVWLAADQYRYFQGKVEEDHLGIDVLGDVQLSFRQLVHQVNDIAFVDVRGELDGESRLIPVHVIQFGCLETIDKVFTHQPLAVS